jgi:hypothetical protein
VLFLILLHWNLNLSPHNLGYSGVQVKSMRETSLIYSGTDQVEDSYFFATAEVSNNSDSDGLFVKRGDLYVPMD